MNLDSTLMNLRAMYLMDRSVDESDAPTSDELLRRRGEMNLDAFECTWVYLAVPGRVPFIISGYQTA
jgi:hypothetical protein